MPIGDVLQEEGPLTDEQLRQALDVQKQSGQPLGEILINLGFCSQDSVEAALARQAGIPLAQIHESDLDPQIISLIPAELAYRRRRSH